MRVLIRGKVARRLIIANAAVDPVVLDHFCSYPRTRESRFC